MSAARFVAASLDISVHPELPRARSASPLSYALRLAPSAHSLSSTLTPIASDEHAEPIRVLSPCSLSTLSSSSSRSSSSRSSARASLALSTPCTSLSSEPRGTDTDADAWISSDSEDEPDFVSEPGTDDDDDDVNVVGRLRVLVDVIQPAARVYEASESVPAMYGMDEMPPLVVKRRHVELKPYGWSDA